MYMLFCPIILLAWQKKKRNQLYSSICLCNIILHKNVMKKIIPQCGIN